MAKICEGVSVVALNTGIPEVSVYFGTFALDNGRAESWKNLLAYMGIVNGCMSFGAALRSHFAIGAHGLQLPPIERNFYVGDFAKSVGQRAHRHVKIKNRFILGLGGPQSGNTVSAISNINTQYSDTISDTISVTIPYHNIGFHDTQEKKYLGIFVANLIEQLGEQPHHTTPHHNPVHRQSKEPGVQKAYLFCKKYCDDVLRALTHHDGSFRCLTHDRGSGLSLEELNQATNEGVRYAKGNDWDEMVVDEWIKILLILLDSFRAVSTAFSESPDVERRLYGSLNDIRRLLESSAACICVLVGPTTEELIPKREWYKLATSLATAARMDIKMIAVAPPRGDNSYAKNRADMIEAIEM
ncbi:hypothetical protein V3C99_017787 [Haemonchus contortus]